MAGKKNAKQAVMTAQNLESAQSSSRGKKRKMADNHVKGARDRGHGRSRPGLARDTRRADITAQEGVHTRTNMTDSNRSNSSPRTGEWSFAAVQDNRKKQINADPVPDMDPDPDPDPDPVPRQHLTDNQGDGNEGMVIALRGLQVSFTAMSGRPRKNGNFPQLDRTNLDYLRFRQRWKNITTPLHRKAT
jgi:hypothetical protein